MGMDIGAREKECDNESEVRYTFAPDELFKHVGFINGTDMRCTQLIRRALNFAGIDFREIESFIILSQEEVPQMIEKIELFLIEDNSITDYEKDVIASLIKFMNICNENKLYITIG